MMPAVRTPARAHALGIRVIMARYEEMDVGEKLIPKSHMRESERGVMSYILQNTRTGKVTR